MQIVNTKLPNENIQTYQPQMIDSGGRGVNDQMQMVNTKLPNENIQTYQPQMIDSGGGGGKWPNANCEHQTTKWKNPNLPTTNNWFWGGGGCKLPNANCDETTKWYHQSGSEWLGMANFAQFTTFPIFPTDKVHDTKMMMNTVV